MGISKKLLSLLLLLFPCLLFAQFIQNSSFEGPLGPSRTPPGWIACGQGSTPDTQPGSWNVLTPPSSGRSYLSMICRGEGVPFPNKWEICQQRLDQKLEKGGCYYYTIDLARSSSFASAGLWFTGEAKLRIWGGNSSCGAEKVLWESGPVVHTDWQTYEVIISPENDYEIIFLEAFYKGDKTYSGNILIDDFLYNPEINPCYIFSMDN
ncbi:MAG: hypothetical protein MRZ79_12080 [Bacteroidia bacterium]|nr:hypothetical protein [Bacteroidia bacterium]